MLKILQARLQQYLNLELQRYKLGLEKAEEAEIKLPTSSGSYRSKGIPEKYLLCLIDYEEAYVDPNKLENS